MSDNVIYYQAQPFIPIDNRSAVTNADRRVTTSSAKQNDFSNILQKELSDVRFSQHAQSRMQSRNMKLTADDMEKLSGAMDRMEQKGARESLVYLKDMAFVVSVANRTIITAMDGNSAKDNVFTNIDSAVIL